MRTPPLAYFRMRTAYARWFWKLPASLVLLALAMFVRGIGHADPERPRATLRLALTPVLFAAAAAVLLDSVKDRAVYETNRGLYQATSDTMPATADEGGK